MSGQEVYEVSQQPPSGGTVLYAVQDDAATGDHIVSLDQLVGGKDVQLGGQGISVNLDEPPGPDATEAERDAYYDALARQARESRDKEAVEMVAMARPLPSDEPQAPTAEQRQKLMEQALKGGPSKGSDPYPAVAGGPTEEDRKRLMEQAMKNSAPVKSAPKPASSVGPNAPGADDRMRLLEQAMAQSKVGTASKPSSGGKGANAPSDEQRRKLLEQAQASVAAPKPSQPASGPSAEEKRKLLAQAQAQSKPAQQAPPAGGPTEEQRRMLMQQAQKQSGNRSGGNVPSAADRQRLMQQAMQKK